MAARAEELVAEHGGRAYASLDDVLADDAVDVVVNLTVPSAHAEVTRRCLERASTSTPRSRSRSAGPRRGSSPSTPAEQGVRLSCAPATLLGEAQQTAWKLVRDGSLGRVRAAYAEANWGRIESWHPGPESLYEVGPLVDVAVYPITILTAMFGPARRVTAFATTLQAERTRLDGVRFRSAPRLPRGSAGARGRRRRTRDGELLGRRAQAARDRVHGDEASLWMADFAGFGSRLQRTEDGTTYTPVPLPREPYPRHRLGAAAGRPRRGAGEEPPAPHGRRARGTRGRGARRARMSSTEGRPVELASDFPRPEPLEWAR